MYEPKPCRRVGCPAEVRFGARYCQHCGLEPDDQDKGDPMCYDRKSPDGHVRYDAQFLSWIVILGDQGAIVVDRRAVEAVLYGRPTPIQVMLTRTR